MLWAPLRWLGRNLSTLLLAFVLAVVVWVSAVIDADPNVEAVYPFSIDIEVEGLDASLLIVNRRTTEARLTILAPRSIWDRLNSNPELVRAWIDLSGLGQGEHVVEVKSQIAVNPAEVVRVIPEEVQVVLEPLSSSVFPVQPLVNGNLSLGYRREDITVEPESVTVSGPASLVNQVVRVRASLDISGVVETVRRTVPVQAINENGNVVTGVSVIPQEVTVTQEVSLLGGYDNKVVKVVTNGMPADGYWITNVSVSPPNVLVFSSDPSLVNEMPGFVETRPIELSGLTDDIDIRAELNLPEGVRLAEGRSVLVRIGIAALEGSKTITLTPEVIGLSPQLEAQVSPETVDLILSGPLPVLNSLNAASVRVALDLSGLDMGTYQVTPVVDLVPTEVRVESLLPETVQVIIGPAPTPTATLEVVGTILPSPTPLPATPEVTDTPTPEEAATVTATP